MEYNLFFNVSLHNWWSSSTYTIECRYDLLIIEKWCKSYKNWVASKGNKGRLWTIKYGAEFCSYCLMSHPVFHIKVLRVIYFSDSLRKKPSIFYTLNWLNSQFLSSVAYGYIIIWSCVCQKFTNYMCKHIQVPSIKLTAANHTYIIDWYIKIKM